jgi:hypothetical protein
VIDADGISPYGLPFERVAPRAAGDRDPAEPVLAPRGPAGVLAAAVGAGLVVMGLSPRWREEGLGEALLAVARDAEPPTLLVRAGLGPGGLAPEQSVTRFSWTLGPRA